jgi:hypothetical protein
VFSYAGKSFKVLRGGAWTDAWGWQELRRVRIEGIGARWAAACDVPDLELLPARYPGVKTVEFHAALELGIQHVALWTAAGLRRTGLPLPIERWAASLDKVASWLDAFGSERGGMLVSVTGTNPQGARKRLEWHVVADDGHGRRSHAWRRSCSRKIARNDGRAARIRAWVFSRWRISSRSSRWHQDGRKGGRRMSGAFAF